MLWDSVHDGTRMPVVTPVAPLTLMLMCGCSPLMLPSTTSRASMGMYIPA